MNGVIKYFLKTQVINQHIHHIYYNEGLVLVCNISKKVVCIFVFFFEIYSRCPIYDKTNGNDKKKSRLARQPGFVLKTPYIINTYFIHTYIYINYHPLDPLYKYK